MRWKSLLVLTLAVAGLAWLALRRAEDTLRGVGATPQHLALVPELAPERVAWIRIDSLERNVQLKLERDGAGRWFLTDPIAYEASRSVVELLLRTLELARGEPVGEEAPELGRLGLAPPKIVVTLGCADEPGGAAVRETRLEVGAVDLVGDLIHVRVPDHPAMPRDLVARSTRALYNTLDRNADDYRERRVTSLSAQRILGFERHGRVWLQDREAWVDLELRAERVGTGWMRVNEPTVSLEPNALGLLCRAAAELEVRGFQDDAPESLARYGLDPPMFTVEVRDLEGERAKLEFGHPVDPAHPTAGTEIWFCRRDGYSHVWWIEDPDVQILIRPVDELYDYLLVRARREDITKVELERGGRKLVLERLARPGARRGRVTNEWEVTLEGGADGARYRADLGAVQDLLPLLEATELILPAEGEGFEFEPGEAPASIAVHTSNGQRWGGHVGAPARDPASGAEGRHFRRFDEGLSGLVPEPVAELLELGIEDLRSSRIHRIREVDVGRVDLVRGEKRFSYVQREPSEWLVRGQEFPAPRAFSGLLVHLFSLSAERWLGGELDGLAEGATEAATVLADVTVTSTQGESLEFRLARGTGGALEGQLLCREEGRWSVVDTRTQGELWGHDLGVELEGLFGP